MTNWIDDIQTQKLQTTEDEPSSLNRIDQIALSDGALSVMWCTPIISWKLNLVPAGVGLSSVCPSLTLLRVFAVEEFSSNLASSWVAMERTLFSRSSPSSAAGGALWQDNWCHAGHIEGIMEVRGGVTGSGQLNTTSHYIYLGFFLLLVMFYISDLALPLWGSGCPFDVSC